MEGSATPSAASALGAERMAGPRVTTAPSVGMEPGVSICLDQSGDVFATPLCSTVAPLACGDEAISSAGGRDVRADSEERPCAQSVEKSGSNHVRLQLTPEILADRSIGADDDDEVPVLFGYLYKRSPDKIRFFKPFDWRFFVVCDGKVIWWKDEDSCLPPERTQGPSLMDDIMTECVELENNHRFKGMVNLNMSAARVVADPQNETLFYLEPVGEWAEGSTTDKSQDPRRVYVFDATGSEHPRAAWIRAIQKHIDASSQRTCRKSTAKSAYSEYWEDDTMDDEQQKALARLTARIEARRAAHSGPHVPRAVAAR